MRLRGADILAKTLIDLGVDTVFGYPGGAVLTIYDALYKYRKHIRHILTSHEQGASHAADGYARATGRVGVVISTSGPGATNLVTGIAAAYMDSIPMVAICGNVEIGNIGRDSFQEVYIAGITMPVTKHNFVVRSVEELAPTVRLAFKIANEGRRGPVLVDIPKDIASTLGEYIPQEDAPVYDETQLDTASLERAAELINAARRPMILFGGGVKASRAGDLIRKLSQKGDIPFAYTMMGVGTLEPDEARCLGMIGMHGEVSCNLAAAHSDCILAIGTRFSDRVASHPDKFAKNASIIHIDIDESEIGKNVRCDCGIVGDAGEALASLIPMIEQVVHPEWNAEIASWQAHDLSPRRGGDTLSPCDIIDALVETDPGGTVYTTDVGQHQLWAAKYLCRLTEGAFLTSGGLGAMGYGYGAAIGAAIATENERPRRRIIHITGDGSFHMNMTECATAVANRLNIVSVIFNNGALGMVRQWQRVHMKGHYKETTLPQNTDYVKIAEGFGGVGFVCTTKDELVLALKKAEGRRGPVWIDCRLDPDEAVLPMLPPTGEPENSIKE